MDLRWLSTTGLLFEFFGTLSLVTLLFVSKKDALEKGVDRWAADTDEENLELPKVQELLRQSKRAKFGGFLILIGVVVQVFAIWVK